MSRARDSGGHQFTHSRGGTLVAQGGAIPKADSLSLTCSHPFPPLLITY